MSRLEVFIEPGVDQRFFTEGGADEKSGCSGAGAVKRGREDALQIRVPKERACGRGEVRPGGVVRRDRARSAPSLKNLKGKTSACHPISTPPVGRGVEATRKGPQPVRQSQPGGRRTAQQNHHPPPGVADRKREMIDIGPDR